MRSEKLKKFFSSRSAKSTVVIVAVLLIAAITVTLILVLNKDKTPVDDTSKTEWPEAGVYYYDSGRDEYTLTVAKKWKQPVKDCSKGLAEGFIPPEPTYSFDHSHAWGGTPLYSVPQALTGLEIIEAGYEKIKINFNLILDLFQDRRVHLWWRIRNAKPS